MIPKCFAVKNSPWIKTWGEDNKVVDDNNSYVYSLLRKEVQKMTFGAQINTLDMLYDRFPEKFSKR